MSILKTANFSYAGLAGLIGLGIYQLTSGDYAGLAQSFVAVLALLGVKANNTDTTALKADLQKKGMV